MNLSKEDRQKLSKAWMRKNIKDGNFPADFHACPECGQVVCSSTHTMFCSCKGEDIQMVRLFDHDEAAKFVAGRYL